MAFPHDGKKFKKGQSVNPSGENYKKSITKIVREYLEKTTEAKINGKVQEVQNLELMLEAQLRQAIERKDTRAFTALLDRAYGKVKETVEIANPEGEVFLTANMTPDDDAIVNRYIKRYIENRGIKKTKDTENDD